jgi:hypothetical protein
MAKLLVCFLSCSSMHGDDAGFMRHHGAQNRPGANGPVLDSLPRTSARLSLPAAMMVAMMMPMMPAVVAAPTHFGGHLFGTIQNCRGGAGTAQRKCLGALDGGGQQEQSANGGKAQECLHVHG